MKWYNPQSEPFKIYGLPFYETDKLYRRLPSAPKRALPEAVDGLANETAGGQIRFHAKLKELAIQVSVASKKLFFDGYDAPHLSTTSKIGFDFYASVDGGDYIYITTATDFNESNLYYESKLLNLDEETEIDVLLYFPLYGAIDKVMLGFDDEAEISIHQKTFKTDKKLVIYGGSIQQGACASRPGMVDSNILSRMLDAEVYNLGFNSSGKAEEEVADVISDIRNVGAYIISTEGNCPDGDWICEKLPIFVKTLTKNNPGVPVVIMPFPKNGGCIINPKKEEARLDKLKAQMDVVSSLQNEGYDNVTLFLQDDYIEQSFEGKEMWHEVFSDGLHKTDLGYYSVSKGLYNLINNNF